MAALSEDEPTTCVNGDLHVATVRREAMSLVYRLVGFDAPETRNGR
jgi:hypothetical protein